MSKWQSMETAPKDGSAIMIYGPTSVGWHMAVVYWHRQPGIAVWVSGTLASGNHTILSFDPTHWMPIPKPPRMPKPAARGGKRREGK